MATMDWAEGRLFEFIRMELPAELQGEECRLTPARSELGGLIDQLLGDLDRQKELNSETQD